LVQQFETSDLAPNELKRLKKKLLKYPLWLSTDKDLHWSSCEWNQSIVSQLAHHMLIAAPELGLEVLDEDAAEALIWELIRRGRSSWTAARPQYNPRTKSIESRADGMVRLDGKRAEHNKANNARNRKQYKYDERVAALEFIVHDPSLSQDDKQKAKNHLVVLRDLGRDIMSSDTDWVVSGTKVGYTRKGSQARRRYVTYFADIWEDAVQYVRLQKKPDLNIKPRQPVDDYRKLKYHQRPMSNNLTIAKGLPSNFYHTKLRKSWGPSKAAQMKVGKPKYVSLLPIDGDLDTDKSCDELDL
jgi:hypothetical protein